MFRIDVFTKGKDRGSQILYKSRGHINNSICQNGDSKSRLRTHKDWEPAFKIYSPLPPGVRDFCIHLKGTCYMVLWNSTSCTNSCLWSVWELSVPQTSSFSCWYGTELCVRYIFCQNGSDVLNSASELLALSKFLVRFYKLCMMWIGWKMKLQNVGCRICFSTWRARIDESV